MNAVPNLPNLTPDDRVWRVDWFGDCGYPGSVRRYAQPSVKVVLSALRCDSSDQFALLSPEATDHQHSHEAWVPVSALPIVAIGDLWQSGERITSPEYQKESFNKVQITPETASFVKAGLALDEQFLIPLNRHPWHRLHTQSYCVSISLSSQRRLLVPCMEIIRFYFGSSSNLLQRLFTNPLTQSTLWASKRFDSVKQHLHLVLANRLSGASASDIGRIAESPLAWRSAAGIHASCQKAAVQRHPVYPYTGFPFEGSTDLMVSGIWLPFGDIENSTFLVYRLLSCSHQFPFKSLSYESSDRKAMYDSKRDQGDKANSFAKGHESRESRTVDKDPDAKKNGKSPRVHADHRFPDLVRKPVWREKIEAMPKADVFLMKKDGSLEQVAFGEGCGQSDATGTDVRLGTDIDAADESGALPRFVKRGLKMIAELPEFVGEKLELKLVCLPERTQPVFNLPVVIDENGEINEKLIFRPTSGGSRPSRACFVEAANNTYCGERFLILEGAGPGLVQTVKSAIELSISGVVKMVSSL